MTTSKQLITVAELERTGAPEGRWELVNGELVELPLAWERDGRAGGKLLIYLGTFVRSRRLGTVFGASTGFALSDDPPMVRVPTLGFVSAGRRSRANDQDGFVRVPPDLAVEMVYQATDPRDTIARAKMWLAAGTTLAWMVNAATATIIVLTADQPPAELMVEDTLDGGSVLPGFTLPLRAIFDSA